MKIQRYNGRFVEIVRFGLVGCTATIVHYALYLLLKQWINYNVAYTLGYALSFIGNFFLTSYFTFHTNATLTRGVGFTGVHLFNYTFQMLLLNVCVMSGINKSMAPVVTYSIVIPVQFLMVRYVFRHHQNYHMEYLLSAISDRVRAVVQITVDYLIRNRRVIATSFFIGLLAYMFFFTNLLLNHDSVGKDCATGATLSSGRWGLEVFAWFCPPYLMPWFIGIVSLFFLCITANLIVNMLKVEHIVGKVLLAGVIVTFPSFIAMYAYIHTAIPYSFSFLLSVMAVWLFQHRRVSHYLYGALGLVGSLSIYQGYVAVAFSLILVLFIQEILYGNDCSKSLKHATASFTAAIGAMAIYFCITKILLIVLGIQFNSYADGMLQHNDSIVTRFVNVYWHLARFLNMDNGLINTHLSQLLHLLLFGLLVIATIKLLKQQSRNHSILLMLSLAMLPMVINIYEVLTPGGIYAMILASFFIVYNVVVIIVRQGWPKAVGGGKFYHFISPS